MHQFRSQSIKPVAALQRGGQSDAAAAAHRQAIALPQLHLHDGRRILVHTTALHDRQGMKRGPGAVHASQRSRCDTAVNDAA